jgi:hypothetical protein
MRLAGPDGAQRSPPTHRSSSLQFTGSIKGGGFRAHPRGEPLSPINADPDARAASAVGFHATIVLKI